MADIFDEIAAQKPAAPAQGDIFDQVSTQQTDIPAQVSLEAPAQPPAALEQPTPSPSAEFPGMEQPATGGDVFDQIAPTSIPEGAPQTGAVFGSGDLDFVGEQEEGLPGVAGAARSLSRGGASGLLRAGEMMGQTLEWFAPEGSTLENVGQNVAGKIKSFRETKPGVFGESKASQVARGDSEWNPRGWFYGGGESVGMMTPGLAIGGIPGAIATGGLFWGGTAQEAYNEINEKQPDLPESDKVLYANQKGLFEGGVETLQQLLPFSIAKAIPKKLKGQAIKKIVGNKAAVDLVKDYVKMIAGETSMEVFQEFAGGATDYQYDLRKNLPTVKELSAVIGPTIIATGILGTSAHIGTASERAGIQAALADKSAPMKTRQDAVERVHQAILAEKSEGSKELANAWLNSTAKPLQDEQPITIQDDDFYRENGIAAPKEVVLDSMLLAKSDEEVQGILEQASPEDRQWIMSQIQGENLEEHLDTVEEAGGPVEEIRDRIERTAGVTPELETAATAEESAQIFDAMTPSDLEIQLDRREGTTEAFTGPEFEAKEEYEKYKPSPPSSIRKGEKTAEEVANVFIKAGITRAEAERLADIQTRGLRENRQEELNEAFKPEFKKARTGERTAKEIANIFIDAGMDRGEAELIAEIETSAKREKRGQELGEVFAGPEAKAPKEKQDAVSLSETKAEEKLSAETEAASEKEYQQDLKATEEALLTIPAPDQKRMKAEAKSEVDANPVYEHMAKARSEALDLKQIKDDYTKTSLKNIPGHQAMFTLNGRVSPDDFASRHGYNSLDEMIETFKNTPAKTKAAKKALSGKVKEYGKADRDMKEAEGAQHGDTSFDFGPAAGSSVATPQPTSSPVAATEGPGALERREIGEDGQRKENRALDETGERDDRRKHLLNEKGEFRRQSDVSTEKLDAMQEDEQGNIKKLDFKDPEVRTHVAAVLEDDVVPEFIDSKKARIMSAERAQELLKLDPEMNAYYIEMDIANVGGGNDALGNSGFDVVFGKIGTTIAKDLDNSGGKYIADKFRHGGDELSAVVVGKELSQESIEKALYSAAAEIEDFVSKTDTIQGGKLSEIAHPKHEGDSKYKGVNIHFAVKQLSDTINVKDTIADADKLLERRKKGTEENDEYKNKIGKIRGIEFGTDGRDGDQVPEGQPKIRAKSPEGGKQEEVKAERRPAVAKEPAPKPAPKPKGPVGKKIAARKAKAKPTSLPGVETTQKIQYALREDGSKKNKNEYTKEEWAKYTKSVIDSKLGKAQQAKTSVTPDTGDSQSSLFKKALEAGTRSAKSFSDFMDSGSLLGKIDDLIQIPIDARPKKKSPNTIDSLSPAIKRTLKGVLSDTKSLSNIIGSDTFLQKGFSGLDAKTQRLVKGHVLSLGKNLEVLDAVIELIPVDVMNNLASKKISAESLFNNPSVFKRAFSGKLLDDVSTVTDLPNTLIRAITFAAAEVSARSVGLDLVGPAKDALAASSAVDIDHGGKDTRQVGESKEQKIFSTKTKLTSEDGRAYILEDLALSVFKAGQTIRQFSFELKKKLGKVFYQIKDKVKDLYDKLNANLDKVTLGAEKGAISIEGPKKEVSTEAAKEVSTEEAKKGEEMINKIIASMKKQGFFNKELVSKQVGKYEKKISALKEIVNNNSADITEKQTQVRDVLKELPMHVRGKAINEIVKVGKFKTTFGREKAVNRAMGRIVSVLDQYYVSEGIKEIDSLLKKAKKAVKKQSGVTKSRTTPETLEMLNDIRSIIGMNVEQVAKKLDEILPDESVEEPTDDQIQEIALLNTFGDLRGKTSEEIAQSIEHLQNVIDTGKFIWQEQIAKERERRKEIGDMALEVISSGKEAIPSHEKGLSRNIIMDSLKAFSDKSQSWQFLMEKLSRFEKESRTLKSGLKRFVRMAHGAASKEKTGILAQNKVIQDKIKEIYGKSMVKASWTIAKNSVDVKNTGINLYDENGKIIAKDIKTSQNKAYKKWMEWQDNTLRDDLARQGVTEQTIKEIEKFMTPEVKKWAEWQLDEFYPGYHGGINDVFRALTYTDMPNKENYSPTRRDHKKGSKQEMTLDGSASYHASMMKGAVKQRVKNNLNLSWEKGDGDSILSQHIAEMEHFKAWSLVVRDLRSVFGRQDIGEAISDHHGDTIKGVVNDFIERFVRGGSEARDNINALDRLRSMFTVLVLAGNNVVFIKQLTSIPAYAMSIPVKDFMKGFTIALANPLKAARILMKSDAMKTRYSLSRMERDISLASKRTPAKQFTGRHTLSDNAMVMTKLGDKMAIILGGYSAYLYHYNENLKKYGDKKRAHNEALTEFDIITESAQQASGQKDLSVYQTGGSIQKGLTMFMTTPASYARYWEAAVRNLLSGKGSAAENLKIIAITHVVLPAIFQLVASGGEWDEQKMKRALTLGPLNGLFLWRDILSGIADQLFLGKNWGFSAQPHLEKLYEIATKIADRGFDIKDVTSLVAATRTFSGIMDAISGKTEHPIRRSIGYSESALDATGTSYAKYNKEFNRIAKEFEEDRTKPRPDLKLEGIKSFIAAARKEKNDANKILDNTSGKFPLRKKRLTAKVRKYEDKEREFKKKFIDRAKAVQ